MLNAETNQENPEHQEARDLTRADYEIIENDRQAEMYTRDLCTRILQQRDVVRNARRTSLREAVQLGKMLIELRGRISKGWYKWLKENGFSSPRTVADFMQLAEQPEEVIAHYCDYDMGVKRALVAIRGENAKPKPRTSVRADIRPSHVVATNITGDEAERLKAILPMKGSSEVVSSIEDPEEIYDVWRARLQAIIRDADTSLLDLIQRSLLGIRNQILDILRDRLQGGRK